MRIFGWLAPSGRFVECEVYEHIQIASTDAEMRRVVADLFEQLESIEEGCRETAEREGSCNAEWHIYEIACDRLKPRIINKLYGAKFIRVGEADKQTLCFEGFPDVIKSRHQACKDFAEQYGMESRFEPVR